MTGLMYSDTENHNNSVLILANIAKIYVTTITASWMWPTYAFYALHPRLTKGRFRVEVTTD